MLQQKFDDLINVMNNFELFQDGDDVCQALNELGKIIKETEARLIGIDKCQQEINKIISKYTVSVDGGAKEPFTLQDHDRIYALTVDIDKFSDLNDDTCVVDNWYELFPNELTSVGKDEMEKLITVFLNGLQGQFNNFNRESRMGTVYIANDENEIYCTPFYSNENEIPFDVHDKKGNHTQSYKIMKAFPTNLKEFEDFKIYYTNLIQIFGAVKF